MLIHSTLPEKYKSNIDDIYNHYKNNNLSGEGSVHYWINDIENDQLVRKINIIRNAEEIKDEIKKHYPDYSILSVHESDEVYLSVSPSKRVGSDIGLSDCHYDPCIEPEFSRLQCLSTNLLSAAQDDPSASGAVAAANRALRHHNRKRFYD